MGDPSAQSLYRIERAQGRVPPDALWDSPAWRDIPALTIGHHMGDAPSHRPLAQAKLQYDAQEVYVIFRVQDRFVRSVVTEYQGDVCTDSCVEFFFTPGGNLADGYFNIEVNCGGNLLFKHQTARDQDVIPIRAVDAKTLSVFSTLPSRVDPEIVQPITWQVAYRVTIDVIANYAPVTPPGPGASWRANFYKCADLSSHPHWLTWAPVALQRPDFHRKEFFGALEFSGG
jgi:hypothetical protein